MQEAHSTQSLPSRLIGEYTQNKPGPLLFFIGGIHGNEPSGVHALRRVYDKLQQHKPSFKGQFRALIGNRKAFIQNKRYLDRDMNRLWLTKHIDRVNKTDAKKLSAEELEIKELLVYVEESMQANWSPKIVVDLHSTSAPGGLFSIVTDDSFNRELAESLYAPAIFNLASSLNGTTIPYFMEKGWQGVAFEGGQHIDPDAVGNHEAAIWLALEKMGCLKASDVPNFDQYRKRLQKASANLPEYVSVIHRHPISPEDKFRMRSGFINFQEVQQDQDLAEDKDGIIISPTDGLMLMPLYQPQGEDGFFVIEEIDQPPV